MKNLIGKQYIRKPTIFKSYYLEKDPDNARTIHGNIRAHHSDVLICPDCGSHFRRNKSWHHVRTLKHQTVVQAAHKMMEAMTEIQDKCKKLPRKYRKILWKLYYSFTKTRLYGEPDTHDKEHKTRQANNVRINTFGNVARGTKTHKQDHYSNEMTVQKVHAITYLLLGHNDNFHFFWHPSSRKKFNKMDKLENQSNEKAPTFFSLKKTVSFLEKKG